jgi:hypothetical protein
VSLPGPVPLLIALCAAATGGLQGFELGTIGSKEKPNLSRLPQKRNREFASLILLPVLVWVSAIFLLLISPALRPQVYRWLQVLAGLAAASLGIFASIANLHGRPSQHHSDYHPHSHWFFRHSRRFEANDRDVNLAEVIHGGIVQQWITCAATAILFSMFSMRSFGLLAPSSFCLALFVAQIVGHRSGLRTLRGGRWNGFLAILIPFLSSAFTTILGIAMLISALFTFGNHNLISRDKWIPFVSIVLLGIFLGMRHSTDPDHVVAVSTIVTRQRSIVHSAVIGMLWGMGHSLTIFVVGAAIIIFRVIIPPRLGLSMEFCVALMLILLGVLNLTGVMRWITERLTPLPQETSALIPNNDRIAPAAAPSVVQAVRNLGLYQALRPFAIGLVHGLAGSAAVALLVLSTIQNPLWATAYLLVFGAGTMVGMMVMTTAMAVPLVYSGKKYVKTNGFLTTASGVLSMAFGLFLVYHIGLVDGLFTGRPHWIPQ